MILDPLTGTLITGEPFPVTFAPPPTAQEIAANALDWRMVALRVTAGSFDHKGKPPQGSLAKSLIIGLRGQAEDEAVAKALRHIKPPKEDE